MAQLYAICRHDQQIEVRHVQLTRQLSDQLDGVFLQQELQFNIGIDDVIEFTGEWKPDVNELLVIRDLPEAQALLNAANQNAIALPALDVRNFQGQGVKALYAAIGEGQGKRLLVQNFLPQQVLSGGFTLISNGEVLRRLTEPAFSLGTQLLAIITSANEVRFKSYAMLRRVFNVTPIFREATDVELRAFCAHGSLAVADIQTFVAGADEGIRKHVHAIAKADVFANHPVEDIRAQAASIGFPVTINQGRIEIPVGRKETKALFSFLLNKVYLGPIDRQLFITNSNRRLV